MVATLILGFDLDLRLAHSAFYDEQLHLWLGGGANRWWAQTLLHSGGQDLIRSIAVLSLLAWLASFWPGQALRRWRYPGAYVLVSILVTVLIVGTLKATTHVDCPWDLSVFGGTRPYIGLLHARPAHLPHAACFPGGHSASGFALFCFYFLFRDHRRTLSRVALVVALLIGTIFAFGQQARGAHFLSHDLTSAIIAWMVSLGVYRVMRMDRQR